MSKPPLPDLQALQTFVTFSEANSMTLAAARLGVSQSAVSQLIKRLEADMGCALLDREVRPAQLTHAGRTLLVLAQDLLSHAASVAERVRQAVAERVFASGNSRPLALTVSVGLALNECETDTPEVMLKRADVALYRAKREGRNRVVFDAA